jgi:hypothetical protein
LTCVPSSRSTSLRVLPYLLSPYVTSVDLFAEGKVRGSV